MIVQCSFIRMYMFYIVSCINNVDIFVLIRIKVGACTILLAFFNPSMTNVASINHIMITEAYDYSTHKNRRKKFTLKYNFK